MYTHRSVGAIEINALFVSSGFNFVLFSCFIVAGVNHSHGAVRSSVIRAKMMNDGSETFSQYNEHSVPFMSFLHGSM